MRLSRRVSVLERRDSKRLGSLRTRKKHKRLDAICENVFNRNHSGVKAETNVGNVHRDETDLRRSTRVRRAPEVLDASPSPVKKRRRIGFRSGSDSVVNGKRKDWVKNDTACSTSRNVNDELGSWGFRLRARVKNGRFGQKQKRSKRRLFQELDEVPDEVEGEVESSGKDGLEGKSTVVKSKRPGRIKASNILENSHHESESSSDEGHASDSSEVGEDGESNEVEDSEDVSEVEEHVEKDAVDELEDGEKNEVADLKDGSDAEEHGEKDEVDDLEDGEKNEEEHNEMDEVDVLEGRETNEVEELTEKDEADVLEDGEKNEVEEYDEMSVLKACDEKNQLGFNGDIELLEKKSTQASLHSEDSMGGDNFESVEPDLLLKLSNSVAEKENQKNSLNVGIASNERMENGKPNDKPLDNGDASKTSRDTGENVYLRVGRRCGLCETGSDGKPPKKLVEDGLGSDREAYSGSSASEDVKYDACDGFGDEPAWLGRLLGPINDRHGIAGIWVHQHCAVWSPEVYFAGLGCLKNIRAALFRGRVLKCTRCRRPGATIGCRVDRCPKTYHLPCARANACIFDHRKFLIACTDHRHLFQPQGSQYLYKIKKLKAKKMKLEIRKLSNDACRKDLEDEEKWLENCGEDEEFLKRESKRLHRDLLRIAPVYIGGSNFDNEKEFHGWESVAGLQHVIQSLKEVVILPLLYPEFFSNMGLTPPRGVLLHGYPGTGKTLIVRALIGSCARGDKRIAYFARKGADCLGKYVGDAERQLRLLFQVAEKSQPSIIFFDEIDGLAPCRTRQQDQTHNSVVSTLLALLDGLKSRGSVVVIGATNRPDAVDPALRRPGRFDREIYFPLPSDQDREAILSLHTRKWPKPVTGSLLRQIARRTVGFAGADLQSLCTQAAINALRRNCPFQEILSAAENKGSHGKRPPLPSFNVEERDWLEALRHAPPPCSQRRAEIAANDVVSSPLYSHLIPCLLQPLSVFLVSLYREERTSLPPPLYKAAKLVKGVLVSAMNKKKLPVNNWWYHAHDMLQEADILMDIEIKLAHSGIVIGQATQSNSIDGNECTSNGESNVHCLKVQGISSRPTLLHNVTCASEKQKGFFLLISGSPRSGQRYLASCLLHCFTGNSEIQKLDLASISLEGQGDVIEGVTRILMKSASIGSSMIFMPRIDFWAIEACSQLPENGNDSSTEKSELPGQEKVDFSERAASEDDVLLKASYIWNIFVEQVKSTVSSSLTILATSEIPFETLPDRIREFFQNEKLKCRSLSVLEETIPRFSIHLDGSFNRDNVIKSSALKLSKDLVQQFVQLINQRVHVHTSSYAEVKSCDTLEGHADDQVPANEHERAQCAESSLLNVLSPSDKRFAKGKSNLLISISTLGYQILRYPHFAELCWVTSKLKEGPCTNTRGPWRGWPFNSCIIRPDNSSEKVAVTCSSSNMKSKVNCGIVRGLVAVALFAYRGTYTTLREVSSEVRTVLELLADEINAKIRAGKDSYLYTRLLSQMAYFEDVVNSWAYSLQSLEDDAQATIPTSNLLNKKSRDIMPPEGTGEQKDAGEPDASGSSFDALTEKSTQNFDLNELMEEGDSDLWKNNNAEALPNNPDQCTGENSHPNPVRRNESANNRPVIIIEDDASCLSNMGSLQLSSSKEAQTAQNALAIDTDIPSNVSIEEDGPCIGNTGGVQASSFEKGHDLAMDIDVPSTAVIVEGNSPFSGNMGIAQPSRFEGHSQQNDLLIETDMPSNVAMIVEESPHPGDLGIDKPSSSEKAHNQQKESAMKTNIRLNDYRQSSGHVQHAGDTKSNGSNVTCFYRCCSECLFNLRDIIGKILIYEWELRNGGFTVEDVHDFVVSVSMTLHSSLRKLFAPENSTVSKGEEMRRDMERELFGYQEKDPCFGKDSEAGSRDPVECRCHSETNSSPSSRHVNDMKFICRDGMVSLVDSEEVTSLNFHCKFETLCLCSLIEWIVMTKQPSG